MVPWVVYEERLGYIMYEYLCIVTHTKKVTKYDNNSMIHQADSLLIDVCSCECRRSSSSAG